MAAAPAGRLDAFLCAPAALLLFVLPFAHVTALRQTALALTVAAALWVWRREPGPPIPLKLPLALWLGMALASLLRARNPMYSLGEIRSEVVYDIVYFFAFYALTRRAWHWHVFRGALLAGLLTFVSGALWLYAVQRDLNVDSMLGGVLSISSYLITVFPLLPVVALELRGRRWLVGGVVAGAIAVLWIGYLTFNRMFILAIDLCGLVLAATLIGRHVRVALRPAVVGLAGAAFLASALFFYSVAQHRVQQYFADKTVRQAMYDDPRWEVWSFSVGLIREHPLTGIGFGLFAARDLYSARFDTDADGANTHAHNPFLNYAVQMGVGGAAVLAFLLVCLLREFWALWRSGDPRASLVGATGLAMALAVLLKAQPDDLWGRHNGYLFWALTGMMLGYARRLRAPAPDAMP